MPTSQVESLYQRIWSRKSQSLTHQIDSGSREALAFEWLQPGDSFLDIGCGAGILCRAATELYTDVHGCDISQEALSIAQQPGITCHRVDLNQDTLPFESLGFDAVTALEVIEHLFDPPTFLNEVHRILKPGGQLILSTPNFRKIKNLLRLFGKGRFPKTSGDNEGWDGGHLAYFTRKDLLHLLDRTGFTPSRTRGIYSTDRHPISKQLLTKVLGTRLSNEFIAGGILVEATA
jgi:methionine biosynthesis protein MetW